MEGKQLMSAEAPAIAAASMHEEAMGRPMEQLKEEAIAPTKQQRGWMQGTTALEWVHWASIKSKALAAGEYAVLRTRQGITMLGEPELGLLSKAAAASDESQ
ncbi:unnamed protein product [Urochloa humidicola]